MWCWYRADIGVCIDYDIGDVDIGVDIGDVDVGHAAVDIDHVGDDVVCLKAVEYLEQAARLSAEKPVVEGRLETSEIYSRFRAVSHRVRGCCVLCCTGR